MSPLTPSNSFLPQIYQKTSGSVTSQKKTFSTKPIKTEEFFPQIGNGEASGSPFLRGRAIIRSPRAIRQIAQVKALDLGTKPKRIEVIGKEKIPSQLTKTKSEDVPQIVLNKVLKDIKKPLKEKEPVIIFQNIPSLPSDDRLSLQASHATLSDRVERSSMSGYESDHSYLSDISHESKSERALRKLSSGIETLIEIMGTNNIQSENQIDRWIQEIIKGETKEGVAIAVLTCCGYRKKLLKGVLAYLDHDQKTIASLDFDERNTHLAKTLATEGYVFFTKLKNDTFIIPEHHYERVLPILDILGPKSLANVISSIPPFRQKGLVQMKFETTFGNEIFKGEVQHDGNSSAKQHFDLLRKLPQETLATIGCNLINEIPLQCLAGALAQPEIDLWMRNHLQCLPHDNFRAIYSIPYALQTAVH